LEQIDILKLQDRELEELSRNMLLSLSLEEMHAVRDYFAKARRSPTGVELEIIAQTWSEHCIHKTMAGIIDYEEKDSAGKTLDSRRIDNLLKETVFKATEELDMSHCLSVFKDNAGVIELDGEYAIAMKVETHNHPSAIEPYGGAATGIGGVIRDVLGCGMGARPVMNIDVFCFGNLDISQQDLPPGVLHPRRVFRGVVRGVRDYGNRMGIPTSCGAVLFAEDYMYNPLVYCGTVGIMPRDSIDKKVSPGELILAIGGRTGRDGLHGATFSSIGLDEATDSACVQIGDPITEKKFMDILLKVRDMGLYSSITDCGAGGFSSAVGEMGEYTGARVLLDKIPLKYEGLEPWEIFLSESQERMVLSVPPENMERIVSMLEAEDVESAVIGEFTDTGKLEVFSGQDKAAELDMDFLHSGVPKTVRKAVWHAAEETDLTKGTSLLAAEDLLLCMLSTPNIASKEAVIRQYDHEVQGGAVLKPLDGFDQDIPQDGSVTRPLLDKNVGIAVGLGINPFYGEHDPYLMALSSAEEAARNAAACGGDMKRAAFMDNFCWGDTSDEKQLAGLVRASEGCRDVSLMLRIQFVSGKDSLNNFYITENKRHSIPGTLLITCVAPVGHIDNIPGSGFKNAGSSVFLIGNTYCELGKSAYSAAAGISGGSVPRLRDGDAPKILSFISDIIGKGIVSACHDLSEGGLSVALAEMAFSGIGAEIDLDEINIVYENGLKDSGVPDNYVKLFSESNSRFLVQIEENNLKAFIAAAGGLSAVRIGSTIEQSVVRVLSEGKAVLESDIAELKNAWRSGVRW
jgi:phosphoribosylformylglycinamidine synthase II